MTNDITWHKAAIGRADRERLNGHKGLCLWFTGISGAGKSTIANAVEARLHDQGVRTYLIDGDNMRFGLNQDLGFSPEARQENVRRVGHVANLFVDAGVVVLVALISPYREDRDKARSLFPDGSFVEIHVNCPVDVCVERDPKGLYEKALSGEIKEFTGISSPYEAPLSPEVTINTASGTVTECVDDVFAVVAERLQLVMEV